MTLCIKDTVKMINLCSYLKTILFYCDLKYTVTHLKVSLFPLAYKVIYYIGAILQVNASTAKKERKKQTNNMCNKTRH